MQQLYFLIESQNGLGWKGLFKAHLVQHHWNEQGHLQLDKIAQNPIPPNLKCFQGWSTYHLSGQPVLLLKFFYSVSHYLGALLTAQKDLRMAL